MTTTRPAPLLSAPVSVHSVAAVELVLGMVPRAPRLPSDACALALFAGPRSVRVESIRELIASALRAA